MALAVPGAEADASTSRASSKGFSGGQAGPKTPVSASVDLLKGELHVTRQRLEAAQREGRTLESERQKLVQQVVGLESQRRQLQQDVHYWRTRCLGFEQESASLAVREDTVQAKLREAHTRERELAVKCLEGKIHITEAENDQVKARAEACAQTRQAQQLESKLSAKSVEVETLRSDAITTQATAEAHRVEVESLQAQLKDAKAERDAQKQALVEAAKRQSILEDRLDSKESALEAASAKNGDFASEVAKHQAQSHSLEEANRKLRLDLQAAISQAVRAGEVPFYCGGGDRIQAGGAPACVEDLKEPTMGVWKASESDKPLPLSQTPRSPLSARTRYDYPKSPHAKQLRQKVLDAREEALNYMDKLENEKQ